MKNLTRIVPKPFKYLTPNDVGGNQASQIQNFLIWNQDMIMVQTHMIQDHFFIKALQ